MKQSVTDWHSFVANVTGAARVPLLRGARGIRE
jgi:hypothetical protein